MITYSYKANIRVNIKAPNEFIDKLLVYCRDKDISPCLIGGNVTGGGMFIGHYTNDDSEEILAFCRENGGTYTQS